MGGKTDGRREKERKEGTKERQKEPKYKVLKNKHEGRETGRKRKDGRKKEKIQSRER
jgi:hypothetical protein